MTTNRELAEIGVEAGEDGAEMWTTTLRALGSPQCPEIGTQGCIEFVAAQVFGDSPCASPGMAGSFVEAFIDCYELETLSDVDKLLGRESWERDNYQGQQAFVNGVEQ